MINHSYIDGLWHPFVVKCGMAYYWFYSHYIVYRVVPVPVLVQLFGC